MKEHLRSTWPFFAATLIIAASWQHSDPPLTVVPGTQYSQDELNYNIRGWIGVGRIDAYSAVVTLYDPNTESRIKAVMTVGDWNADIGFELLDTVTEAENGGKPGFVVLR